MRRNAYGKLSLRDMRFALKVNKSLMNEGFRELKWTCPLFYIKKHAIHAISKRKSAPMAKEVICVSQEKCFNVKNPNCFYHK